MPLICPVVNCYDSLLIIQSNNATEITDIHRDTDIPRDTPLDIV
ncbi:MAG: hypothetical protein R3C09_24120 [Pirellulaceae bacterium]